MQAYKLKGTINQSGQLIIEEPIKMIPGEVEVIILQAEKPIENHQVPNIDLNMEKPTRKVRCKIKAFQDLLEKTQPAPPDFDPDQARWEALKEKYDL